MLGFGCSIADQRSCQLAAAKVLPDAVCAVHDTVCRWREETSLALDESASTLKALNDISKSISKLVILAHLQLYEPVMTSAGMHAFHMIPMAGILRP